MVSLLLSKTTKVRCNSSTILLEFIIYLFFVNYEASAFGPGEGGLAYGDADGTEDGIHKSVAIEFDTYKVFPCSLRSTHLSEFLYLRYYLIG